MAALHSMWHVPDQGSNLYPVRWKHRVLTIGRPGTSHHCLFRAAPKQGCNTGLCQPIMQVSETGRGEIPWVCGCGLGKRQQCHQSRCSGNLQAQSCRRAFFPLYSGISLCASNFMDQMTLNAWRTIQMTVCGLQVKVQPACHEGGGAGRTRAHPIPASAPYWLHLPKRQRAHWCVYMSQPLGSPCRMKTRNSLVGLWWQPLRWPPLISTPWNSPPV